MSTTIIVKNGKDEIIAHDVQDRNHYIKDGQTPQILVDNSVKYFLDDHGFSNVLKVLESVDQKHFLKLKSKTVKKIIEMQIKEYKVEKYSRNSNLRKGYNNALDLLEYFKANPNAVTEMYRDQLFEQYMDAVDKNINTFMKRSRTREQHPKNVNKAMQILKKAKKEEDIKAILSIVYDKGAFHTVKNIPAAIEDFHQLYNFNENAYLDVLSEHVIKNYFANLLAEYSPNYVLDLATKSFKGEDPKKLILELDNDFDKTATDNGLLNFSAELLSEILEEYFQSYVETLCWECQKGYPNKCSKICDIKKKSIDKYDFITQGYQLVKDHKLETFIVTDCDKFEKATSKNKVTAAELRQLKGDLERAYYGVNSLSELKHGKVKKMEMSRNVL